MMMKIVDQKMDFCSIVDQTLLFFKQVEFALEMFVQILIQLLMLMLNNTKTATNTGLEAVFNQETAVENHEDTIIYSFSQIKSGKWLGPTGFLVVSILLTFISIVTTHLKIIKLSKGGFLPFTAKIVLALKVLLASILRITVFFSYFAPFLGLPNLLAHWKADQIPFVDTEFQNMTYDYWSIVDNSTKTVLFTKLHPGSEPPHYSHYTVLGLGQAYLVFWTVLAVQLVVVLITKQWFSQQFRQAGLGSKLLHGLHCLNIPDIHTDWDENRAEKRNEVFSSRNLRMRETASWFPQNGPLAPLDMLRKRRREVVRELAATQLVNCIFNLLLLTPIIVTGMNIRKRHEFIHPVMGAFPEEVEAYTLVSFLMWLLPLLVVLGAGIDFALFCVYQMKLHTWKGLLIEAAQAEDVFADDKNSNKTNGLNVLEKW